MDQYTRRIIGFGVHAGNVMMPHFVDIQRSRHSRARWKPRYLSSVAIRFISTAMQANLRILEVTKSSQSRTFHCPSIRESSAQFDGYLDHILF
jgi:hypothetical protein